jgi:predicted permease
LTVFATLACGLLPAWQAARESISPDLHRDNRMRLRRTLVTAQITITLVVLATGSLFVRNLLQARSISPGFDVTNTVRAAVKLPPDRYNAEGSVNLYIDNALGQLRAIPGVRSAAAARVIPFTNQTTNGGEITFSTGEKIQIRTNWNAVSRDYFRVMAIPFVQGDTFPDKISGDTRLVVVNRTFTERYLSGRPVLGTTFRWGFEGKDNYRIVGVVEGTKNITIGEDPKPQLYECLAQLKNDRPAIDFVLSSAIPPAMQIRAVHHALQTVEPAAGAEVATLYSSIGLAFLPSQIGAALLGSVGALGLLLAAIGLYGTMIYSVARRNKEIGVRIAIGASRRDVSLMVLAEAARLLITGGLVGLAIAYFVTKPLAMFLVPGLKPADPAAFIAVAIILIFAGLAATVGPVRRALSIDPVVSLRYE